MHTIVHVHTFSGREVRYSLKYPPALRCSVARHCSMCEYGEDGGGGEGGRMGVPVMERM